MGEVNVRTVGHLTSGRVQLQFWDFGSNCLVWSAGSFFFNARGGGGRYGPQLLTLVQCHIT